LKLNLEDIHHIALLARINMTDEEIDIMREQLSNILDHFDLLQQLDTTDVEPSNHSIDITSVTRADLITKSIDRDRILSNVPRRQGDFVRVKGVLE
jgi:aspartyl-tRNA(Asn)/glutamyl-tRNA(Gln) amidotransferase subunit C